METMRATKRPLAPLRVGLYFLWLVRRNGEHSINGLVPAIIVDAYFISCKWYSSTALSTNPSNCFADQNVESNVGML